MKPTPTAPAAKSQGRSWLTLMAVLAIPMGTVGTWATQKKLAMDEPYPALMMPAFSNVGRPDSVGPYHEPIVEIIFDDGSVRTLLESEFLSPMEPSHFTTVMRKLFQPYGKNWETQVNTELSGEKSRWVFEWCGQFAGDREIASVRCVWYDVVAIRGKPSTLTPFRIVTCQPA